jgi:hypothetical protein
VKSVDEGNGVALAPRRGIHRRLRLLQAYEARRGTVVRVRDGHWKSELRGMRGTIQACWGHSEHAMVNVRLEDGRWELFWLPNLATVDEDIAV